MAHPSSRTRPASRGDDRFLKLRDRMAAELTRRADHRAWIEANLQLRTKDRQVIPFRLNAVQQDYYRRGTRRDIILKARQVGCTTISCALFFADTVLQPNTFSVIVAHDLESAALIFRIVRLFQERLPEDERRRIGEPHILNRREIYWAALNARFFVATAGSRTFGRGQTINNVLCSEFARWPDPEGALVSLTEAVPADGRIIIESTANGMGGFFHDLWTAAKAGGNGYRPRFYPWWWDPQYRMEGPPLGDLTEEEAQLMLAHGLDQGQIRWRRAKVAELRDRFPEEYPEDDVTCFLASGRCVFETAALAAMQRRIQGEAPPDQVASIMCDGTGVPLAPACLLVWQHPQPGREYVIGADTGGGGQGGDPAAACVLNYSTGEQAAELHGPVSPERFGHLLNALGWYYNKAELAVERNNHGHSTLSTLLHTCGYPNLYHHLDYDEMGGRQRKPGWPTDLKTKPLMIDGLAAAIAEQAFLIHSSALIDECYSYVVTDSGSTEAQPGKHDDRVIAAAIAWQVRKQPKPVFRIARA